MRKLSLSLVFLLVTSAYVVAQSGEQRNMRRGPDKQAESLRGLKGVSLTVDLFDRDGAMDAAERRAELKVLQDDAKAKLRNQASGC